MPTQAGPSSGGWRNAWRTGGVTWLFAMTAYTLVTLFSPMRPAGQGFVSSGLSGLWRNWSHWDSNWYELIATYGYTDMPAHLVSRSPAFYPLYPGLMALLDPVLPGPMALTGLLISVVAFLGLLVVLFRLIETEFGDKLAGRGIWLVIAFPSGFFLIAPFNMSLLLLLMVSSVYAMRRQRWWLAGLLGGLAVLTRPSGLMLVLPFAYEYLRFCDFKLRRIRPGFLWIGAIPGGLAAYMAYCWAIMGNPLAPSAAQELWTRHFAIPVVPAYDTAKQIYRDFFLRPDGIQLTDLTNIHDLVAVFFVGALVVLAFVGPWKFAPEHRGFGLLAAGMFLFSLSFPIDPLGHPPLMSAMRYVLEVFPAFIVLARIATNILFERAYLMTALTLQGFFLVQFLHSDWIG